MINKNNVAANLAVWREVEPLSRELVIRELHRYREEVRTQRSNADMNGLDALSKNATRQLAIIDIAINILS
jgi:hypothetical protein